MFAAITATLFHHQACLPHSRSAGRGSLTPDATRLARLTEICIELPEATRRASGRHATFSVRKRTFAYYLVDHRGNEGITGVVCKAAPGEGETLIAAQPQRYYRAAYLSHRGWVGLRLDLDDVDWAEVTGRVVESYRQVAPKRLVTQLDED